MRSREEMGPVGGVRGSAPISDLHEGAARRPQSPRPRGPRGAMRTRAETRAAPSLRLPPPSRAASRRTRAGRAAALALRGPRLRSGRRVVAPASLFEKWGHPFFRRAADPQWFAKAVITPSRQSIPPTTRRFGFCSHDQRSPPKLRSVSQVSATMLPSVANAKTALSHATAAQP